MFNFWKKKELSVEPQVTTEGSTFKVPLTKITSVANHPNADRLDICSCYDFKIITQKGKYSVGDPVFFIPPDSVLTEELEKLLFPPDSKIVLTKRRVKQIRIRKVASQGMLVSVEEVIKFLNIPANSLKLEQDYSQELKIVKYEPPYKQGTPGLKLPRNRPLENPLLHKFNGVDNYKWFPNLFTEGEDVVIEEKIHGTSSRYALLPSASNTLWKKIKKFFRLLPKYEFCLGSNNVQLQERKNYTGFYEENVYSKIAEQENIKSKLKPGETIYGEIVGDGIQKNYNYGCKSGEHKFVLFDVKYYDGEKSRFLVPSEVEKFAEERGFEMVPILYRGPFNKELAYSLTKGNSVYCPSQKVREGVVIKSAIDMSSDVIAKKMLKIISEEYLDSDQSDYH